MDELWDARGKVASIVGCERDELSYSHDYAGGALETVYERAGTPVGRLIVGGPTRPLDGTADEYYEIRFQEVGGRLHNFDRVRARGIEY